MIGVIDYGTGNQASVLHALRRAGMNAMTVTNSDACRKVTRLILPGVGAFDAGMRALTSGGMLPIIEELVCKQGMPLLGICLGMHLLTTKSEEGEEQGLGWIPAETVKLSPAHERLPHMGWNTIVTTQNDPLLAGLHGTEMYFAHSYVLRCEQAWISATTEYGTVFPAIVRSGNLIGVQFHPEKSHDAGLRFLQNFASLPC